jgi:NAD(P)-dependent dehydrogenase (short-subunit alcohol dehydrogenase family)
MARPADGRPAVLSPLDEALALAARGRLLDGQVVVLTGATGGIGCVAAQVLAAAGASLAAVDLDGARVGALEAELGAGGTATLGGAFDASDTSAFATFRARVEAELGPVDGLVNLAGLFDPAPYDAIDPAGWEGALQANLGTTFAGCQTFLPGMVERGRGSVVNVSSTAGEYGSIRPASHYAAAKGGVIALTRSLAREVGPAGVRVNALSPGPIDTLGLVAASADARTAVASRTLLGRLGRPDEIAMACVFLLSPLSSYVTGHVLGVNGGALLWP